MFQAAGLKAAHVALATALTPFNGTMISNYFTPEAEIVCEGGMIERGGAGLNDVKNLQYYANRTCGLHSTPCLVDYHAQYADIYHSATFNATLAAFLAGAGEYAYYGRGSSGPLNSTKRSARPRPLRAKPHLESSPASLRAGRISSSIRRKGAATAYGGVMVQSPEIQRLARRSRVE